MNAPLDRYQFVSISLDQFVSIGRYQIVSIPGAQSPEQALDCCVPQGSVLGPLLFTSYTLALSDIARKHNLGFHVYENIHLLVLLMNWGDCLWSYWL